MRISELETTIAERNHRIDMLQRDVADKASRLRRLTELSGK